MTYTLAKAVAITGIKKDMLHYLCKAGFVVPTSSHKQGERGHGVRRKYTFTDLVSFKVIKKLCESGVSPLKVNKAIHRASSTIPTQTHSSACHCRTSSFCPSKTSSAP